MDRTDTALLVIRLMTGSIMVAHGWNKIRNGLGGTANWFAGIGMKWPALQARTAAATEIAGGLLFAAGLLFPFASASVMATMLVAIVTVHRKVGFFIFLPGGGWEYCALIAVVAAAASIAGAGHASVDRAWGILQSCSAGWMGVLGGVSAAVVHLSLSWRPGNAQA